MSNGLGWIVCALVVAAIAGILSGFTIGISHYPRDCELLGQFRHEGKVYRCVPAGQSQRQSNQVKEI